MEWLKDFEVAVFSGGPEDFEELALRLFAYQYRHCAVYRAFAGALGKEPSGIRQARDIPFLPIDFFRTHRVCDGSWEPELVFESSGTTGASASRHLVRDAALYRRCLRKGFEMVYGDIRDYVVIGLLPSYLERQNSSLVYMVRDWIDSCGRPLSGFYLREWESLRNRLEELDQKGVPVLLIGVSFALMDFASRYELRLKNTLVMETGGMKGPGQELIREELHGFLKTRLGLEGIHSEYGMTELLSQAYAPEGGVFIPPPWMRVWVRQHDDPLGVRESGTGALNIIDLANIHSCAFVATDDIGRVRDCGEFEVLGRLDGSALRGCSLLVS